MRREQLLAIPLSIFFAHSSLGASIQQRPTLGPGESNWIPQSLSAARGIGLQTQDLSTQSAQDLVDALVGVGPSISNVSFIGSPLAGGTFNGGTGIVGFESGIVLSSGNIASITGPSNLSDNTSTNNGRPGDADLSTLVPGQTYDAATLEFDLDCSTSQTVSLQFVFMSEEYNSFVGTAYDDVFACFVNGQNIATVPGTSFPISVNNVNCGQIYSPPSGGTGCEFFINNVCAPDYPCAGLGTEMDGFTRVVSATAQLSPGPNHVKLALADTGDRIFDAAVLVRASSLACNTPAPVFDAPTPCNQILTVAVDETITFQADARATNGLSGQSVAISATGAPGPLLGGTFSPPLPTMPTQPSVTVFEWTPTLDDVGLHSLTLTATDQLGQTESCSTQILVELPPPNVACVERLVCSNATPLAGTGVQLSYWNGRAVIGSPDAASNGGVCFFEDVDGTWLEVANFLHPSPSGNAAGFGEAVSISGDWAVVGAPFEGGSTSSAPGGAYVFRRTSTGGWAFFQELFRSGITSSNDAFGISVAVSGNYMVVTAGSDDTANVNAGAVYVFRFDGNAWQFDQKLLPSNGETASRFGLGLSIDGERVAVGTPFEDFGPFFQSGATYVFERQSSGAWVETARLDPPDLGGNVFYGVSVDVSGTRLIVGAEGVDSGGFNSVGRAYVYRRDSASSWTLEGTLDPLTPSANLTFGQQVGIRGSTAVVNSRRDSSQGAAAGAVYIYGQDSTGGWSYDQTLFSPNAAAFDNFGQGLALGFGVAFIGTPGDDPSGVTNAGAGYLFDLGISDCNTNGTPDSCEIASGAAFDCNGNGTLDSCDIASGVSQDCDLDLVPDECQIAFNPLLDCNNDGVLDSCQLATMDCNSNGVIDSCETLAGTASDLNGNLIPDECESNVGTVYCSPNAPNNYSPTGGRLGAIGTASVIENDVVLIASDLPSSSFGIFLSARQEQFVPMPPNSIGILCLGGAIGRFNDQIQTTGIGHELVLQLDNRNVPQPNGLVSVLAGERWFFQAWHRDLVGSISTSNFTEGIWIQY